MDQRWQRRDGVKETPVDSDLFLVLPADGEIFHLNALGAALWRLLETPMSVQEAAVTLALAFPDAPQGAIDADSARFFTELRARNLLVRA